MAFFGRGLRPLRGLRTPVNHGHEPPALRGEGDVAETLLEERRQGVMDTVGGSRGGGVSPPWGVGRTSRTCRTRPTGWWCKSASFGSRYWLAGWPRKPRGARRPGLCIIGVLRKPGWGSRGRRGEGVVAGADAPAPVWGVFYVLNIVNGGGGFGYGGIFFVCLQTIVSASLPRLRCVFGFMPDMRVVEAG